MGFSEEEVKMIETQESSKSELNDVKTH